MNGTLNDSPEDITSVDLTIRAASGNLSPIIYANGRNQLQVEIIAKAMKENPDNSETILKFTLATWIHLLNLRHAESDEILSWHGSTGWCFTASVNDYSREVIANNGLTEPRYMEPGDELITLYIYTDDISSKRIAVSIDTSKHHFTTADNASGAEKCSVTVRAIQPLIYRKESLIQSVVTELGKTQVAMHYSSDNTSWSKKFDAHYDNLYFSVQNKMQNYTINNYGGDGKRDYDFPLRCAIYWRDDNHDQHILIANPSDFPEGTAKLGFHGKAIWQEILSVGESTGIYDLFQTFKFNDRPMTICWTHFYFAASQAWELPDGRDLNVNDTDLYDFNTCPWFEFHDLYGNYGAFNIRYDAVSHQIEVDQR